MADLAATYYVSENTEGTGDGLSLANAMALPGFITNRMNDTGGFTLVSDVEVRLVGDPAGSNQNYVLGGALDAIARDATTTNRITWAGYSNADGTTRAEVTIDANGGAFDAFLCTTADNHTVREIHFTNTDRNVGNQGLSLGANADNITVYNCRASWCYVGFDVGSALAVHLTFCYANNNADFGFSCTSSTRLFYCIAHNNGDDGIFGGEIVSRCISYDNGDRGFGFGVSYDQCISFGNADAGIFTSNTSAHVPIIDCMAVNNGAFGADVNNATIALLLYRFASFNNTSGRTDAAGANLIDIDDPGISADPFVEAAPKYTLAAGASGATAADNGAESNIEDLDNGSWGGSVEVGDRIRFFENSTAEEDGIESVVTAVNVGADADVITVSPQVTAGAQKQCWLGGGNFALNDNANGGTKCRNTTGRATVDGWSTDYLDIGGVQHLEAGGGGAGIVKLAGAGGGLVG